jgi:hypothetical protein
MLASGFRVRSIVFVPAGEMAERLKAHDWKSCVPQKGTEGSNPSLSAIIASVFRSPSHGAFGFSQRLFEKLETMLLSAYCFDGSAVGSLS